MSDEEDTVVLLSNEKTTLEKESKIEKTKDTYQDQIKKNDILVQSVFALIAILTSGICFGFDIGVTTSLIKPISFTWKLNCGEEFYIVSVWLLGAIMSAVFGGFVIDICGRKWTIVFTTTLLTISSVLCSISKTYAFLLCSRFMSGFNGPLLAIAQYIYIAETSNPKGRGFRIVSHFVGSSLGSLLVCLIVLNFEEDSNSWRLIQGLNAIPAIITLILTLIWLPKSPHFVLYQKTCNVNKQSGSYGFTIILETILISLLLVIFQQFSGRYTVFFYAPRLFSLLGICTSLAVTTAIVSFSIVKVIYMNIFKCIVKHKVLDHLSNYAHTKNKLIC